MSEASGGSGSGKAAGASDQQCVHCKREVAELNYKFCPHCGRPPSQQSGGSVPTQQESSPPLCINCNTKLLTPKQKICHECGAHQRSSSSIPTQSGDSQEISSPPGGQPQPVVGATVPSTDTVHQHKVGVQQALEAHKNADSSTESGKDVPPLAPTIAHDWQKEGGDRPPQGPSDLPPVLPPRTLAARFPRPHPPSQTSQPTKSGDDKTYRYPRVFGPPQPHDQPHRSQLVTGHTGSTAMTALQREPLSSIAQGHDTPYDRNVSPQAVNKVTIPSRKPAQVPPTDKQQNGNLPASAEPPKPQQEHVPPPAKGADSRGSTPKGSPPAGPTPVGQGPGTGQQHFPGHPGTSASSTTTTEQPMDTDSSKPLQTTVGPKDSAQPKDTDNSTSSHGSVDDSNTTSEVAKKRKRTLSDKCDNDSKDESPIKQRKTDTPEPSEKDGYTQGEPGSSAASNGAGARDPSPQPSQPNIETPSSQPQSPQSNNQTPGNQPQSPQSNNQTPGSQPQTLESKIQTPGSQSQSPQPDNQTPGSQSQSPQPDNQTPGSQSQSPQPDNQTPGSQSQSPQPDNQTPGSQPHSPRPDNQNPGSQPQSPRPDNQTPGSQPHSPRPDNQNPGSQPHSPRPANQNPGSQPHSPRPANQNPGSQPHSPRPDNQNPGSQPQPLRPDNQNPGSQPHSPRPDNQIPGTAPASYADAAKHGAQTSSGGYQGSSDVEFKRNRKRAWRLDTDNRPREAKQLKEDSWYTGDSDIESGGGYSYDQKDGERKELAYRKPPSAGNLYDGKATTANSTSGQTTLRDLPEGLRAPPDKSIAVTFHVLLPKPIWDWDASSTMHIQFGPPRLGSWNYDLGPLKVHRELPDNFCEMTGTFPIEAVLLKHQNNIPYKYIVHSPKTAEENDCYEYLHDYYGVVNRCLKLSTERYLKACNTCTLHHYDTFAFPHNTKTKTRFQRAKDAIVGAWSRFWSQRSSAGDTKEEEFNLPNLQEMSKSCLEIYLEPYHHMLSECEFPQQFTISTVVEEIEHIYRSLRSPLAIRSWDWAHIDRLQTHLPQVMKEWLESIVKVLEERANDCSGKHLVSAATIAYCFYVLTLSQPKLEKFAVPLLGMLELKGNVETRRCPDYDFLCTTLSTERRYGLANAVFHLCVHLMNSQRKFKNIEWLSAIPLFHFLKGHCQPFDSIEVNPEKITWGEREKELQLNEVKSSIQPGFVAHCFEVLQPLVVADPLLLQGLIYLCHEQDYPTIFNQIPPYLAATWLSHKVLYLMGRIDRTDAEDWIHWIADIKSAITCEVEQCSQEHSEKPESLMSMVDASLLLCLRLQTKLTSPLKHHVEVFKSSISLVLQALIQLHTVCQDDEKVKNSLAKLNGSLHKWITNRAVIGGSLFGGYTNSRDWDAEKEIQLWHSVLQLECQQYTKISDGWSNMVKTLIQKRVSEVPIRLKTDLVCLLEKHGDVHPILVDALMAAGMEAIDRMLSQSNKDILQDFDKLAATHSERVGKLLGTLLKKEYPNLDPLGKEVVSVTFDELLKWHLWPSFIKIQGSESKLKQGMPRECQVLCTFAVSQFEQVCIQVQTGDITMKKLQKVQQNMDQMERLCEAASGHGNQSKMSFKTVKGAFQFRLHEFQYFKKQRGYLSYLCDQIHVSADIQGLSQLTQELQKDFDNEKINKLCAMKQGKVEIFCFKSAGSLTWFAGGFHTLSQKQDLFLIEWRKALHTAVGSNPGIALNDIYPQVWQPAFKQCETLLGQLHDQSMKLVDVDKRFKPYQGRNLEQQLTDLFLGVNARHNKNPDGRWIHIVVCRMYAYWNLCRYRDAANAFLKLKETLKLDKGDFRDVEKLSNELSTSMRDQTLADVDDSLIETARFLEGITSDPDKLECLQEFASCQAVVQWLQKVTKDVGDLQNFVNVALATAAGGEDDLAHDQLSNLRAVGSGFGSLIYNLPKNAGYRDLSQRCKSLWDALKNNPNLPEMLKHCNKELDWYKSVKETQGSVEVTSYGQMDNILMYGCYKVGFNVGQPFHDIHDMIQLKLVNTPKQLPKTSYSLNELRDLESKLVLITGSKAENRNRVDKYLDTLHSVCRIAEVLIDLQQAGNVQYSDWNMEFSCADNTVESTTLGRLAKEMEDELYQWKNKVKETRAHFYELNYYTTLQLSSLRKELGKLKDPMRAGGATVAPGVLALLQSISSDITARDVHDVVMNVTATLSEQHRASGSEAHIPHAQSLPMEVGSNNIAVPSHQVSDSVESNQPTLKDSILASVDTQASTVLPAPQLTADSLSEKQEEVYARLCDFFGFHSKLVLIAIERFGDDEYEIENWVKENADKFEFSEDGGEEETPTDDGASSDSESEPEMSTVPKRAPSDASSGVKVEDSTSPRPAGPMATITRKQPITEYHPVVQKLIESGYTPKVGIEAVERCGSNVVECLDYLMDYEAEGDLFQSSRREPLTLELMEHPLQQRSKEGIVVYSDENAEKNYLSILELGIVLQELSSALPTPIIEPRPFPKILKQGSPNLVVTSPENVLRTALALYMENESLPLPTIEEVLICNTSTTTEEVTLLWQRAIGDPDFRRIFCLLHAEKLSYKVSDAAIRSLTDLIQGKTDYRLVIICSNEDEEKLHIISKLHNDRRPFSLVYDTSKFQQYLKTHFTPAFGQYGAEIMASSVDHENSRVRIVASTRSGMGKSLYVMRMADILRCQKEVGSVCVTIPVHGPVVNPDTVMEFLKDHMVDSNCTIFHFDISPNVLHEVDTILFCLLILRGLSDSHGNVWRCYPSQLYTIEVTLPEHQDQLRDSPEGRTLALLELLPSVECVSPKQAVGMMDTGIEDHSKMVMDQTEFESAAYQRVYQYLRRHIGRHNLDRFSYIGNVEGDRNDCLNVILSSCGIPDPSWSEIRHFIKFLDLQLQSCEASVFCDEDLVGDVMAGLKGFVVKFMIRMSRDFATSSLQGEVARENQVHEVGEEFEVGEDLEQYQIVTRRQWEQSSHPYIFFNQDRISITFVGFVVTRNGDLTDPRRGGVLEPGIMTPQLYTGLKQNQVNFEENCLDWPKHVMIFKLATVMGIEYPYDPDPSYVLTVDNLIKMMAIHMRFRCGIPVVIMGETGCGKTRLIRYMCDLTRQGIDRRNMLIIKVHGGVTEKNITTFMETAEEEARENRKKNLDTILFFDEANTTDAIGLIKEIMCDRRMHGKPISEDIKLIAACNPYRKHTEDMIERLESAGLGFYVRATETQQKLGKIPLRQLVYRVLDLPPSMRPLVYDFGQLNTDTEKDYTRQIVSNHVKKHAGLKVQNPASIEMVARVLAWSQWYMREREDECSFVSLRDVERAMIVFEYFFDKMDLFGPLMDEMAAREALQNEEAPQSGLDHITRSIILAIGVCYHARLHDRDEYECGVSAQLGISDGAGRFRDEIRWCQDVLLDNMQLGPNIAKNAALRENIFMMAICIELRIPLFLVGKPGSSKSLAKAIVASSMQGQASSSSLLKEFKQVHMFSYQCSQLSTPESVIEVFHTAKRFQKKEDTTKYVSVVVLDEVGLAEDSPNLPLKALHPLLEDGTEGADEEQQIIDREKRVAFIGISNWALDPAKMNRGVMVTRGDPDVDELLLSARGICSHKENDRVKESLDPYFEHFAEAYKAICGKQKREFFGLRDFYSLIKMLYWMCEKSGMPPTWPQLQHAIQRNFSGLEADDFDPLKEFENRIHNREEPDLTTIDPELHHIVSPDCSKLGMIKTSLRTKETTWHGENRYLLFLTENYAALEILRHYLSDIVHIGSSPSTEETLRPEEMEPFILFGSSFPKDKEYAQVCRNINKIKICMETGRTVILLNLENLYESLYDVLNQYYIYVGGSRYVDLGLQTHRVKCRVNDNFKLILIAEKKTVYDKFPIPLINRLEKHFVLTSSVLTEWKLEVLQELEEWVHQFSRVSSAASSKSFKECDAFIGYTKDTAAAVVFQATNQLERLRGEDLENSDEWKRMVATGCLKTIDPHGLIDEGEGTELWKQAVLQMSQYLLLQTASPDALIRLQHTPLADQLTDLLEMYDSQHHTSIDDFLNHNLVGNEGKAGLLLQVTTHSHLLSADELKQLGEALSLGESQISYFLLQEFDTELDFSNKVSPAFQRKDGDAYTHLLIIQCDSGHTDGDLIACARHRIYDERANSRREDSTHVLFIIHLPQQATASSFVGFQGDRWISTHIDDLRPPSESTLTLHQAMESSISDLFYSQSEPYRQVLPETAEEPMSDVLPNDGEELMEDVSSLQEAEGMEIEDIMKDSFMQFEEEGEGDSDSEMKEDIPIAQVLPDAELDDSTTISLPSSVPTNQVLPVIPDEEPRAPMKFGYYRRLHGCIQAAASKLQDSTKNKGRSTERVAILLDLIPKDSPLSIDNSSFYGILVSHIHKLLEERVEIRQDEKEWVLNEALNAVKLQNGGTFRNVLARKLDGVIIPIFAGIIGFIDRNYNLNLIRDKADKPATFHFWLDMFRDPQIMQFHYDEMAVREQVPGAGGRMSEEDFRCHLPFSWLIKETFDSQWDNAKRIANNNKQRLCAQLCELVADSPVCRVLEGIDEKDCEEFYKNYLNDFVRSVHKCNHKQTKYAHSEYKLIVDALNSMVHAPEFSSIGGHESLTDRIAAVHVVHHFTKSETLWFGQLASHMPGILEPLQKNVPTDSSEMVLHLYAVEKALISLDPPLAKDGAVLKQWLNNLRLSQNAIDSTLSLPSQHELHKTASRHWQLIRALQIFVEHVLMKYDGMVPLTRRLHMYLKDDPDFKKASTIERVKKHLNAMDNQTKKTHKDKLKSIRRSCRTFFMELVSTLCFRGQSAPDPDLIRMLIDTVFTEKQEELGTKDFTPYKEATSDTVPVIRSFLLQLLLEHNPEAVMVHLNDYFTRSCQVAHGDQNLQLLCVKCFEDALYKESSLKSFNEQILDASSLLDKGHDALLRHHAGFSQETIPLEYLYGVAQVRFAISVVADLFTKLVSETAPRDAHGANANHLLQVARMVCTHPAVNHFDLTGSGNTTGPAVYLLKLLVRQYGTHCLQKLANSQQHSWVIPQELQSSGEEQQSKDPFVIYKAPYCHLRECMSTAAYGKDLKDLIEASQDLEAKDAPLLLLALYQTATLSRGSTLPSKQLLPDVLGELDTFIKTCKVLSQELLWTARALLGNEQGGILAQLAVAPRQPLLHRTLGAIVVHAAAVFFSRQRVEILKPFANMMNNPAALVNAYLPTMPEDDLPEVQRVLAGGGAFYECPRGHAYFVGECGRPVEENRCPVCHDVIGGVQHRLRHDNRNARRDDTTQAGYCLGPADGRGTTPSPERSLSSSASCILRALMHSALIWTSCNNTNVEGDLANLVKLGIRGHDLPEFFWNHLMKDLELLGRATGKSMDEAAVLMHLIIREILVQEPPRSDVVNTVSSLGARNARAEWEKIFNQTYMQPVLERLEERVGNAMTAILNDDKQEQDQLFYVVYERVKVTDGSMEPHLWTYRSRISLEHLSQTLQQRNMKEKYPILHEFLQQEHNLRATQYLPSIVKLQQLLYDRFHHRLDRKDAKSVTIRKFLKEYIKTENVRNEYQEMIESFQKAWRLVGDQLKDHARLRVEKQYLCPVITDDAPLEYLIPSTTGAGACSTALVDFLLLTHNSFIERCRGIVTQREKSKSLWEEHKVPITYIHQCHLLDYEQQLLPIVLSHCRYSLTVGKGQKIDYDHLALEKHILDRFIHGKPLILSDIPQVVYRKDVYTAATFAAVRKKVDPQVPLPHRVQQEILLELRSVDRLRETLDVVDIVLGFLSSGGGSANKLLGVYIKNTLKMRRPFCEKAREYCSLGHIISLWETLSVELARQLTLSGQEPFDTMRQEFLEELKKEQQVDLTTHLRSFDLDQLLGTLYEFIETYIKYSPNNEKDWPLVDTLEVVLERNSLPPIPHLEQFPDTITLAQSAATWKCIVNYQEKHRHEG